MSALTAALKSEIQEGYSAWLAFRGFRARRGQREMIAHIARTFTGEHPRIAVVEAGTGTGKTAAYCIAGVPIAQALGKTLIISTATIALQEQVTLRDLPDLQEHAGLKFDFALAKGRGRYVCLKRLDDALKYTGQETAGLFESGGADDPAVFSELLEAFSQKRWNGERDSWPDNLPLDTWRNITTDHRGCTNNRCGFFKQCPFFKARGELDGVDVIVANHDLVLADLSLGGGAVLPDPGESIFVLDEAHHLPEKTQQHFSVSARVAGTAVWTEQVSGAIGSLTQRFGRPQVLVDLATEVAEQCSSLATELQTLAEAVGQLDYRTRDEQLATHRFTTGVVSAETANSAGACLPNIERLARSLEKVHGLLQKAADGDLQWERRFEAEDWLPVVGQLQTRAEASSALLGDYAGHTNSTDSSECMHARWVNRYDTDYELVSAPIEPGSLLRQHLWSECYAALCTSATLTAVGRFERFFERVGLSQLDGLRLSSPFDFPAIASLTVPDMRSEPPDFDAHSDEVAALLPDLLAEDPSALILFTSWRQLNRVSELLPEQILTRAKIQGTGSKQALLDAHRADVDRDLPSYLLGLASFAEGVDLPDAYCRHVVIVKLPFSVPDDPIDQAMAELAEAKGRNAFYEISVPDAALKLVQACGRLIRHEADHGRITLLDKRIVTRQYGRTLLESLPPYRLVLP